MVEMDVGLERWRLRLTLEVWRKTCFDDKGSASLNWESTASRICVYQYRKFGITQVEMRRDKFITRKMITDVI